MAVSAVTWDRWLFLPPGAVWLLLIVVYPLVATVIRSFFDASGSNFIGLGNYKAIFSTTDIIVSLKNNVVWVVLFPFLVTFFGLVFAVLTERIRWSTAFKTIVFMPLVFSATAAGLTWASIFFIDPHTGMVNAAIQGRGVTRELVAQASEHGYEALVVTVDLPVLGVRERELRTPLRMDAADIPAAIAAGAAGSMTTPEFAQLLDPDLSWSDVEQLVRESPLPVIVKGVLTAEAARLAADHGASGVVVSNHGGRQLDAVLSGADALPEVVEAVGERLDVLVDGGIRRGGDVLKALALGARAVMVGRPVAWGLAVGGAEGARKVLEILLSELDTALALAGAPRAAELDQSFLASAPR